MGKGRGPRAQRRAAVRQQQAQISAQMHVSQTTMVSGPIPAASEMERYHAIDPTIVGRIFDLTEGQQQHRMAQESKMPRFEAASSPSTMVGRSTEGLTSGAADIVTVLGASMFNQVRRGRERKWRAKLMAGLNPDE